MSFVPMYDLESLNEQQRQDYIKAVCAHMGVPDNLNLVMLTYLDEQDGPRRLVAYAKRGAAEIIRNAKSINVTKLEKDVVGGSIIFTATGTDGKGHQEISVGSKWIQGLQGKDLDDAIMTAQTRAVRRMTLQFVGAGVLDESEVNPSQPIALKNTTPIAAPPQPTVEPAKEPGKDVTVVFQTTDSKQEIPLHSGTNKEVVPAAEETQEQFKERMAKMRAEAIASLNASVPPAMAKQEQGTTSNGAQLAPAPAETEKPKRKYTRKARVDLGPSEPPIAPATTTPLAPPVEAQVVVNPKPFIELLAPTITPPEMQVSVRPTSKLTPEQVKPFRQRMFKLVNDHLEPNGFAPKEGMGNSDKMRAFATIMFPEITSINELSIEQWEKFLSTLENKVTTQGAVATVKYIEDAIGI